MLLHFFLLLSEVIFKDPPKIPFKTSIKITILKGYFCLAGLSLKNSLKRLLGQKFWQFVFHCQNRIVMAFLKKSSVFGQSSSLPPRPTPLKDANLFLLPSGRLWFELFFEEFLGSDKGVFRRCLEGRIMPFWRVRPCLHMRPNLDRACDMETQEPLRRRKRHPKSWAWQSLWGSYRSVRLWEVLCEALGGQAPGLQAVGRGTGSTLIFGDRQGAPKNFCDRDFAELSG